MSPSSSSNSPRSSPRGKTAKTTKKPKGAGATKTGKASAESSSSRNRVRNERASRVAARQLRSRDAASLANRQARSSSKGARNAENLSRHNRTTTVTDGLSGLSEQLVNRILKPLGLVVLSRDGITETIKEAADRGRLTHTDAELLVGQLVQLGRQQTEELMSDLERTLGRGRQQLDGATRRARRATPDRIIRGADRARRTIGVGPAFPILGYDELTVAQIKSRLGHLSDPELRKVRDYERRNAERKSLLRAIEKALG